MESSAFRVDSPRIAQRALHPARSRAPSGQASPPWRDWAQRLPDDGDREECERIVHALEMALRYPQCELNLRLCSPGACLALPEASFRAWAQARLAVEPALTALILPDRLPRLPDWLATLHTVRHVTARNLEESADAASACDPLPVDPEHDPPASGTDACALALARWCIPRPGEARATAALRSAAASHLMQLVRTAAASLEIPPGMGEVVASLDTDLFRQCLRAKESLANGRLKRITASALDRLPPWLDACPHLGRLTLKGFTGRVIDLRPLRSLDKLILTRCRQEVDIHSFGVSIHKGESDAPLTHHLYRDSPEGPALTSTLRMGTKNSNGAARFPTPLPSTLTDWLGMDLGIDCAELSAWTLTQWISGCDDDFLLELESSNAIARTVPRAMQKLSLDILQRLPVNHLLLRSRWGEFVSSRFDRMKIGERQAFLVLSTRHAMALQLAVTPSSFDLKLYDPNRTMKLTQRSMSAEDRTGTCGWQFDDSLLERKLVDNYFGAAANHFGEDGIDPLLQLIHIPQDLELQRHRPVPADRSLSLRFGPPSFADCHVGVMRHIMNGQHRDALERMHEEVRGGELGVDRLHLLLTWRDSHGCDAESYLSSWPDSKPIIDALRTHAT